MNQQRKPSGKPPSPLPMRQGVSASRVWVPQKNEYGHATLLDFLVQRFPFIQREILIERMQRGDIVDENGKPFDKNTPYQGDFFLFYYREIPNEPVIPFKETILFQDEHIIVVDKPHFVPVTPTGRFVRESLLARLKHQFQNEQISPIHRLDRETAGVMLFTCKREARRPYQMLFQNREVKKSYEAIAPRPANEQDFPLTRRSRLIKSEPFFIMKESDTRMNDKSNSVINDVTNDNTNAETHISIIETKGDLARYRLKPHTGKQHQLRVHMNALGIPILNDPFYPELLPCKGEDYTNPLQLLARSLSFIDPITQEERYFESRLTLTF